MGAAESKELLDVLEDRYQQQLEPRDWHAVIGDATLADAISTSCATCDIRATRMEEGANHP
ncbi:hypothetical protein [Hyalangium versicolor]|uniref:hypothetical protein n=1 Tax=Hyalangium versicolor TaxID=2861190 RepID=UPI00272ACE5C|nr:hypothetical protein [Hyalangium versicolor]